MFSATFLGHQGGMFSSRETHILVDPLLFDEFGQTATAPMLVYPSRQLRLDALPPISAVFFTHEHEDHSQPAHAAVAEPRHSDSSVGRLVTGYA